MRAHAQADDRHFAYGVVAADFLRADGVLQRLQHFQRFFVVVARHGEGEVSGAFGADVLDDHIDFDIGIGNGAENLIGDARFVGHAAHVDARLVFVECDAGYDGSFHVGVFLKSN